MIGHGSTVGLRAHRPRADPSDSQCEDARIEQLRDLRAGLAADVDGVADVDRLTSGCSGRVPAAQSERLRATPEPQQRAVARHRAKDEAMPTGAGADQLDVQGHPARGRGATPLGVARLSRPW